MQQVKGERVKYFDNGDEIEARNEYKGFMNRFRYLLTIQLQF